MTGLVLVLAAGFAAGFVVGAENSDKFIIETSYECNGFSNDGVNRNVVKKIIIKKWKAKEPAIHRRIEVSSPESETDNPDAMRLAECTCVIGERKA